jgi:hypothetical protein
MSTAHQAAFAAKMEPGETPLWAGAPGIGGLRFWALLVPVAIVVAGLGWTANAAMNFFSSPLPMESLADTTRYFVGYVAPRLVVFLGLPAVYLIAALWLLKRVMRATRYLVTDRAAYIATGQARPRARRYGIAKLRRKTHWRTGTDLLFHFRRARMSSTGLYHPAPEGFKRLTVSDADAAQAALTPLLEASASRQAAMLETLTRGRSR